VANQFLISGGTAAKPKWLTVASPANGGDSLVNPPIYNILVAKGANAFDSIGTGTAGHILFSGGAAAKPLWSTPTYPNTSGTVGQYIQSDGTNEVFSSGVGQADIVAASSGINTTETIVVKTAALAANRLQAGTIIRVTLIGTCTSSAANADTLKIRIGTAGTTADGLVQNAITSVAATSGTNIPFKIVWDITVRTAGASATTYGTCTVLQTGVTGISAQTTQVILPTFTNFNSTTASNIISASIVAAATTTTSTFQVAYIEFVYL
jgi:hypothetical protein